MEEFAGEPRQQTAGCSEMLPAVEMHSHIRTSEQENMTLEISPE